MIFLYSRNDCPLCEDAEITLQQLQVSYKFIDIDSDETLRKAYNAKVPVISDNQGYELSWPFNNEEILNLVTQQIKNNEI